MLKNKLLLIILMILIFSCKGRTSDLKESDIPALVREFLAKHVTYHSLNDQISEKILNNYISSLDYGKYYFYKKDIEEFQKHRKKMDDYIATGRYDFIYKVFEIYQTRFRENMKLFQTLLKRKYNFNKDETIIVDRDEVDYAVNKEEMADRWRKNIKLQLLNYLSADKDIKKAKEKLKKKYDLIKKRTEEINRSMLLTRFVNAYSTALDPHSNFLSQSDNEDFKISMELKLEGIGVRLRSEDGFVIVESIIPGGATDKLPEEIRLKPNDKIVAVAQGKGESVDVIDMALRDVVKKIRGKKGTEVRLTIIREAGKDNKQERMIVPIIREEIKLQDSDAESELYTYKLNENKIRIGYIKLPSFYRDPKSGKSSSGDTQAHVEKMIKQNSDIIILDLRGNPGGLLNEAIDIAGLFIDNGPILQVKDGRNPPQAIYDNDGGTIYNGPLVVLIDKFSASASEIFAGAIKDYGRGLVLGPTNTFGKGTVQSYNELPRKLGAIKVTTHIFYQPSGTSNQLYGIKPDIIIPSLSSIWDIGENKTKYPLKWKKIKSAQFKKYGYVNNSIVSALKMKSTKRITVDKEFVELSKKIKKYRKQLTNKTISLREEAKLEKQKETVMKKDYQRKKNKEIIDLKDDIFLKEAINVTGDYYKMLK